MRLTDRELEALRSVLHMVEAGDFLGDGDLGHLDLKVFDSLYAKVQAAQAKREAKHSARVQKKIADHVDGYDRDDLGDSGDR